MSDNMKVQFFKFPQINFKTDGVHKVQGLMYVVKNGKTVGMLYDNETIVITYFIQFI